MAAHLIQVVMLLTQLVHNDVKGAGKNGNGLNCTQDRKKNELTVKGNLQGLVTIMLKLFLPTQCKFWKSQGVLCQSPTCFQLLGYHSLHIHLLAFTLSRLLPCQLVGFSSTPSWSAFDLDILFPTKPYLVLLACCLLDSGLYSKVSLWKVLPLHSF